MIVMPKIHDSVVPAQPIHCAETTLTLKLGRLSGGRERLPSRDWISLSRHGSVWALLAGIQH
jgi:hypothetical protein